MKRKQALGDKLSGKNREWIPNIAFKVMSFIMKMMDLLGNHSNKNFARLQLQAGDVVIDYGCGPARYIQMASQAVGANGKVMAVDIHPLAIQKVNEKISRYQLQNVEAIQADQYNTPIDNDIADVVYALDMFHMIEKPNEFLQELARLVKKDGVIIIEDGHQPRSETIRKINHSECLRIVQENEHHVRCQKIGSFFL